MRTAFWKKQTKVINYGKQLYSKWKHLSRQRGTKWVEIVARKLAHIREEAAVAAPATTIGKEARNEGTFVVPVATASQRAKGAQNACTCRHSANNLCPTV